MRTRTKRRIVAMCSAVMLGVKFLTMTEMVSAPCPAYAETRGNAAMTIWGELPIIEYVPIDYSIPPQTLETMEPSGTGASSVPSDPWSSKAYRDCVNGSLDALAANIFDPSTALFPGMCVRDAMKVQVSDLDPLLPCLGMPCSFINDPYKNGKPCIYMPSDLDGEPLALSTSTYIEGLRQAFEREHFNPDLVDQAIASYGYTWNTDGRTDHLSEHAERTRSMGVHSMS